MVSKMALIMELETDKATLDDFFHHSMPIWSRRGGAQLTAMSSCFKIALQVSIRQRDTALRINNFRAFSPSDTVWAGSSLSIQAGSLDLAILAPRLQKNLQRHLPVQLRVVRQPDAKD